MYQYARACTISQYGLYVVSVYPRVLEGREETHVIANVNIRDSETAADKHVITNDRYATTNMNSFVQVT